MGRSWGPGSSGDEEIWFEFEGLDELASDWFSAVDYLSVQDLPEVCLAAAEDAVVEMQHNHPYTDRTQFLTGGMHARKGRQTRRTCEAVVEFMAPYSKYVDEGTSRSKPYPFVFIGEEKAEISLERRCAQALDRFCNNAAR